MEPTLHRSHTVVCDVSPLFDEYQEDECVDICEGIGRSTHEHEGKECIGFALDIEQQVVLVTFKTLLHAAAFGDFFKRNFPELLDMLRNDPQIMQSKLFGDEPTE
ncbi:MAG: hypothetical protein LUO93_07670 [Methanomicrobiales archaeon]|nr:hypothetical protein [Methanomicrobiales archaeon]